MAPAKWGAPQDANGNELLNQRLQNLAADMAASGLGFIYFHTATGTVRFTNGSVVRVLGRLDQMSLAEATVDLNGQKISNLGDPVAGTDAVNKNYVELLRQGLDEIFDAARVRAQGNVNVLSPGASVDGAALTAGDRVLLPVQTTGTENDVWQWNGAAVAMTRFGNEPKDGSLIAVAEGTDAGKLYIQTATDAGARGSWSQSWTYYGNGTTYTQGTGIVISGGTISLATPVAVANGGTGGATAAAARTALGAIGKYAQNVGDGAATTYNIVHNLGTTDVTVQVWRANSVFIPDISIIDANTVRLVYTTAPTANQDRVVVQG